MSGATAFDAAAIISGVLNPARLGTGTADSTTYLRGDGTWAAVSSGVSWGAITGTLSSQTDLQNALNTKLSSVAPLILGTDLVEQYNGTTGQKARWYKTRTSSTSGEWFEVDAVGDASSFDIAVCVGSLGGAARGMRLGSKSAAGSFTSWLSFATTGAATFVGNLTNGGYIQAGNTNGVRLVAQSGVQLGSGEFAAWSSTVSAAGGKDTAIARASAGVAEVNNGTAGALRDLKVRDIILGNAAVAETPTATHTLTIKDSTGTTYRILAVV